MHGLSIIIPTYNEKENLKILIPEIYSIIKVKKFEILIVDNNSKDWLISLLKLTSVFLYLSFLYPRFPKDQKVI